MSDSDFWFDEKRVLCLLFCRLPGADTMRVELIRSALFVDSVIPATDQVSANTIKRHAGFKRKETNCNFLAVSYLSKMKIKSR
jgi:hypothetical protein